MLERLVLGGDVFYETENADCAALAVFDQMPGCIAIAGKSIRFGNFFHVSDKGLTGFNDGCIFKNVTLRLFRVVDDLLSV